MGRRIGRDGVADREGRDGGSGGTGRRIGREDGVISDLAVIYAVQSAVNRRLISEWFASQLVSLQEE